MRPTLNFLALFIFVCMLACSDHEAVPESLSPIDTFHIYIPVDTVILFEPTDKQYPYSSYTDTMIQIINVDSLKINCIAIDNSRPTHLISDDVFVEVLPVASYVSGHKPLIYSPIAMAPEGYFCDTIYFTDTIKPCYFVFDYMIGRLQNSNDTTDTPPIIYEQFLRRDTVKFGQSVEINITAELAYNNGLEQYLNKLCELDPSSFNPVEQFIRFDSNRVIYIDIHQGHSTDNSILMFE